MNLLGKHHFNQLVFKIGGNISCVDGDRIFQLCTKKGQVYATSISVSSKISYLKYEADFFEDIKLDFAASKKQAFYFLYCTHGTIQYKPNATQKSYKDLMQLQTVIVSSQNEGFEVNIPKGDSQGFALIKVENFDQTDEHTPTNDKNLISNIFKFFNQNNQVFDTYMCTQNLKIKEQLETIESIAYRGVIRELIVIGKVHCILALQMINLSEDRDREILYNSNLTSNELFRVGQALQEIKLNPENKYYVKEICKSCALTAHKLQQGCKQLTDKTIGAYIQDQRLIYSEQLIKEGNLSISEIVYKIGFSSRSYFSKIFKEKYNCSPRVYLKGQTANK